LYKIFTDMTRIELSNETDRYLQNGLEILQKANKKGKFYEDSKYVKISGHALYSAMLLALDDIMPYNKKGNTEPEYRDFLQKKNKTVLKEFNNAYYVLHKSMGYDGILGYTVIQEGIKSAKAVIKWIIDSKKD